MHRVYHFENNPFFKSFSRYCCFSKHS